MSTDTDLIRSAQILPAFNAAMEEKARKRLDQLTKPQGSLGKLEDIAAWLCGWQNTLETSTRNAYTLIFAGNHGITQKGVSAYPTEVTAQMVENFRSGGAAINQLCHNIASTLCVIPLSLHQPTKDFTIAPAMTKKECLEAFEAGKSAVPQDADIIVLGEMGIGNTTAAAAVAYATCGGDSESWVGSGTGIDSQTLQRKRDVVARAVTEHKHAMHDTLSILQHVGGRELAALAGATWRARELRIPVILDGYVVTAAVAPLMLSTPDALTHCIAGHVSVEPGHRKLLEWLRMEPLLDLNMRLGEGSGAQLALAVIRAATATFTNMATFESAEVSSKA